MRLRHFPEFLQRRADVAIAIGVFLLVAGTAATLPAWKGLERRFFDLLTVTSAPGKLSQPIVLIAINEETLEAMKLRWPFPRKVHAEVVNRLVQGGATAIALDLLLPDASTPEDDAALAAAVSAGNVVVAADLAYSESSVASLWKRADPLQLFQDAGAHAGVATITFDPDQFVRAVPPEPDAFWRQIVKIVQLRAPTLHVPPLPEAGAMIRYLGPDEIFDPIPYHLVLEATPEELRSAFSGRIVIVGRDLRATPELGMAQSDLFATPFLTYSGGLTSGIKIHATIVDNALSGATVRPIRLAGDLVIQAVAAVLSFLAFRGWRPIVGGGLLLGIAAGFGAFAWYLFTQENTWMALAAPLAILASSYLSYAIYSYVAESRRKRDIQRAFSRYVSPAVVDQIVANPERLAIGGEYREITVMFTDLKGFTSLSEQSKPEVVSQILVRHFSAMTEVILEKRGTVVQFIGDAIMAIWGAPLDDRDHALHAVDAGIRMQEAMKKLRAELASEGLPELYMRVGINTCRAIVGNMGSTTRFAYTAQGDGINLASRLEGANKAYGTAILASGETVGQLRGQILMRCVDRVRVSGKSEAVDIFTPEADPALVEATANAFEAYLRRDWAQAGALYGRMRAADPDDRVAASLSERIEAIGKTLVEVAPDGSVSLDKL